MVSPSIVTESAPPRFRKQVRLPVQDAVDERLIAYLQGITRESPNLAQAWIRNALRSAFITQSIASGAQKDGDEPVVKLVEEWLKSVDGERS